MDVIPIAPPPKVTTAQDAKSILDGIFDGFLLAVPKKRRSENRILANRFGIKKWAPHGYKMLEPKTNIVTCRTCGNFHELQYLCGHCYEQNKEETLIIQEKILKELGYDVNDKEISILYQGEAKEGEESLRFVEIPKERPKWFSKNLLSRTASDTTGPTGDVTSHGDSRKDDK